MMKINDKRSFPYQLSFINYQLLKEQLWKI